MAFSSQIMKGELIIHDGTPVERAAPPDGRGRGLLLGFRRTPFGAIVGAPRFPRELLVNPSDIQGMIQEQEERKSRLSDVIQARKLPCKDQQQTNYCWIFAPTHGFEVVRLKAGLRPLSLSPASAGARIKRYRNVGGWGEEGLNFIADEGLVPSDRWPDTAIDRRYETAENVGMAKERYRLSEWWELEPRNDHELISCLLHGFPVAVGLNWWGHEVLYTDAIWLDGTYAIRHRNSWSSAWGSNGFGLLPGARLKADDAVVPRVPLAA